LIQKANPYLISLLAGFSLALGLNTAGIALPDTVTYLALINGSPVSSTYKLYSGNHLGWLEIPSNFCFNVACWAWASLYYFTFLMVKQAYERNDETIVFDKTKSVALD
jgi:hypothetical protein